MFWFWNVGRRLIYIAASDARLFCKNKEINLKKQARIKQYVKKQGPKHWSAFVYKTWHNPFD